jgi:hypothetical protein
MVEGYEPAQNGGHVSVVLTDNEALSTLTGKEIV